MFFKNKYPSDSKTPVVSDFVFLFMEHKHQEWHGRPVGSDAAEVLGPDRTSGCYRGHLKGTFLEKKKDLWRDFSGTSLPDDFASLCL